MKTYLKLITALLVFGLASANAQVQEGNNQSSAATTKFESVEAATKAVVDSVAKDDKAATLALLAQACAQFPDSAADIVFALIQAIEAANEGLLASRGLSFADGAANVDPSLVGEIVATAISAAESSRAAIVRSAILAAPYAEAQINGANLNPLVTLSNLIAMQNLLVTPINQNDQEDGGGASPP